MSTPRTDWAKKLTDDVTSIHGDVETLKGRFDGIQGSVDSIGKTITGLAADVKLGFTEVRGEVAKRDLEIRSAADKGAKNLEEKTLKSLKPLEDFTVSADAFVSLAQKAALPMLLGIVTPWLIGVLTFVISVFQLRQVVEGHEKTSSGLAELQRSVKSTAQDSTKATADAISKLAGSIDDSTKTGEENVRLAHASLRLSPDGLKESRDVVDSIKPVAPSVSSLTTKMDKQLARIDALARVMEKAVDAPPPARDPNPPKVAPVPPPGNDPTKPDLIKQIQLAAIANKGEKRDRPYHFGSQGAGGVFSNHTSHTNRLIPIYTFGRKIDLGAVTGSNSAYRDPAKVKALYGFVPERTVNPRAEYADQSDLYRVQKDAVAKSVKYLFIVWFDGMDWDTTRAAAIAKSGKIYNEGKGSGLIFQDYDAEGSARFGWYVTSPTHDKNTPDLDAQTVTIPGESAAGGYDASIAGPNPWTLGPLGPKAPGYLKGQSGNKEDKDGVASVGGVIHAYTDSSTSAGEFATGAKAYNNGINVTDEGKFVPTLFNQLQNQGWKVGTVTSVPFPHASPAAMYAHNVHRDDYQDLARDMLGVQSITQLDGKEPMHAGLDVVIGTGFGQKGRAGDMAKQQGKNAVEGNAFITDADQAAIDVKDGGKYVVVQTRPGVNGAESLLEAASRAAAADFRLFGFFGKEAFNHLPYRTADGGFDPVTGVTGKAEQYTAADLLETPKLVDATVAALAVLANKPGRPFALFVEAGDVDFALHDNNLDNAIGAVISGDEAIRAIIAWVEKNSNWDDAALIVTADHGHYLVVDRPEDIAGTVK